MPLFDFPYTMESGQTISPHQVNANASALYAMALDLVRKRYNYFTVVLQMNDLADTDTAEEEEFRIRAPFAWEVVSSELRVYGDASSGTDDITLTCDQTGWNTLTATADYGNVNTLGEDISAQNLSVAANTEATFNISRPPTASRSIHCYAILHIRHDAMLEASVSLTAPPQVHDFESYDVTEWNTWFATFAAELDTLTTALTRKRRFEIVSTARSQVGTTAIDETTANGFLRIPNRTDYCEEARHYLLGTATIDETLRNIQDSEDVHADTALAGGGASTWVSDTATVSNPELDDGHTSSPIEQRLDKAAGGSVTITRHYVISSWRVRV